MTFTKITFRILLLCAMMSCFYVGVFLISLFSLILLGIDKPLLYASYIAISSQCWGPPLILVTYMTALVYRSRKPPE